MTLSVALSELIGFLIIHFGRHVILSRLIARRYFDAALMTELNCRFSMVSRSLMLSRRWNYHIWRELQT
jgi:hypothetical protein